MEKDIILISLDLLLLLGLYIFTMPYIGMQLGGLGAGLEGAAQVPSAVGTIFLAVVSFNLRFYRRNEISSLDDGNTRVWFSQ